MSKIKIIISGIIALVAIVAGSVLSVSAEKRSWDDKTQNENVVWENEIKRWGDAINAWSNKRDELHQQYYADKYDDMGAKYCDNAGCWEEGLMFLIFTSKDGSILKMNKNQCGVDDNFTFRDGSRWDCANNGQVLTFKGPSVEFWESSNGGQIIKYKNTKGDFWESSDKGQMIKFKSAAGDKWESSNHGQVVEHTDADGKKWSGSDSDTVDDMR